jgi:hypothetical protein
MDPSSIPPLYGTSEQVKFQTSIQSTSTSRLPLSEVQQETPETPELSPVPCEENHEGIPESVEYERLSELKKVVSEHASKEANANGPGVAKGSATALAQSAMSKYATAISKETGIAHTTVQGVEMADKPIDETQLAEELKNETEQRKFFEIATQGKVIPGGPAEKVEEAAERLEKVASLDGNTKNQTPTVPLDEGIPPSVECQRLSELKKVVHDHSLNEGPEVPKGSATSLAQSAMGKYATVISEEAGLDPSMVQHVGMEKQPVDEVRLAKELKNEAEQRKLFEIVTQGKVLPRGPAKKVEEASERLHKVASLDGNTDNATTLMPEGCESVGMEHLAGLTDNAAIHNLAEVIFEADDSSPFAQSAMGNSDAVTAVEAETQTVDADSTQLRDELKEEEAAIHDTQKRSDLLANMLSEAIKDEITERITESYPQVLSQADPISTMPEAIPPEQELAHLAALKYVALRHGREDQVERGRSVSLIENAITKYAAAMSKATVMPSYHAAQENVELQEEIDEEKLLLALKLEGNRRRKNELRERGKLKDESNSSAAMAEQAVQLFEEAVKLSKMIKEPSVTTVTTTNIFHSGLVC